MPWRFRPVRAWLEQGMLAVQGRLRSQQLAGQFQRALVVLGLQKTRGIMARIVQTGKLGGFGRVVAAYKVILRALVVAGFVREQVEQRPADVTHLVLRAHVLQGQVTLLPVARCLSFRQQTGLFHNGFSKLW